MKEELIRLMLRFTSPVKKGNEAALDGAISQAIKDRASPLSPRSVAGNFKVNHVSVAGYHGAYSGK
jgi:hypothetical protein